VVVLKIIVENFFMCMVDLILRKQHIFN